MKSSNPFVQLLVDTDALEAPVRKRKAKAAKLDALGDASRNPNIAEAEAARRKAAKLRGERKPLARWQGRAEGIERP